VTPALLWLRRWGISLASLIGGLLTLFVFRRDLPNAAWIIGYVLLLWLVAAILAQARSALEARGHHRVVGAAHYAVQTLCHGILLFLLPAYWASTTVTSVNAVFLGVLLVFALVTTFDPWYRMLVQPYPWATAVFLLVSIFGALNVALPLVGMRPQGGLAASAFLAMLALTPTVRRTLGWPWMRSLGLMTLTALVGAWAASVGCAGIPPAPLSLGRGTMARAVMDGQPVGDFRRSISVAALRENGGLVAYTPIHAPVGLRQPVAHVWRLRGRVVDVVSLSPVRGGRREGFRTYSRKTGFPSDPVGRWSVDVVTESGQLIGRLRFRITP
jgi:Family of unknown function (DUF5924)/Protein of unknown function (DUF2914)